jgi:hypothetical protein
MHDGSSLGDVRIEGIACHTFALASDFAGEALTRRYMINSFAN